MQVLAAVADARSGRGGGRSISAEDFFGLTKGSVRNIVERLPDAGGCRSYQFVTIPRSDAHTPKANDSGCARTEVRLMSCCMRCIIAPCCPPAMQFESI